MAWMLEDWNEGAESLWEISNRFNFRRICEDSELCDVVKKKQKNIAEQPSAELSLGPFVNTVKNTEHSAPSQALRKLEY